MSGYTIEVRNNNVEKALRVLKKKLLKDGVMKELRDRQYYQKPSFKKREKKKESIRRHKKDQKIKALKGEIQNYLISMLFDIIYVQLTKTTIEKRRKI